MNLYECLFAGKRIDVYARSEADAIAAVWGWLGMPVNVTVIGRRQ